jgi:chromate transporter
MQTPVDFWSAFRYWLKLGCINFGGPAGQIAIMHRDLVERRRWISEERFLHALNFCMLLPGPEAQQLATYVGWLLHGTAGGLVAGVFFVLPSVFVLLGLSYVYAAHGSVPAVAWALAGLKPVVVAIVIEAVWRIGGRALRRPAHVVLAAGAFVAIHLLGVPFPWIVLGAGLAGWLLARAQASAKATARAPTQGIGEVQAREPAGSLAPAVAPIVEDAQTGTAVAGGAGTAGALVAAAGHSAPAPAPSDAAVEAAAAADLALRSPRRVLAILGTGLALWLVPLAAVAAWRGWDSVYADVYLFFTRAALVTFGGAYAVLAYVNQAAVQSFGWITAQQAVDGLALAETTPGPLIMVLQFVGFMAGWNHPEGLPPLASAVTAALLTTWATFLPCFLFIFLGAPHIERLRSDRRLSGALAGITAAVVGVILSLALFFGSAVLFPRGLAAGPDLFALALVLAALAALRLLKLDLLWVIAGGVAAGLLWGMLR